MRIAGDKVHSERTIDIRYPWTGEVVATVPKATVEDVRRAFKIARDYKPTLTRHERYKILMKAGDIIASRQEAIARADHAGIGPVHQGHAVRGGARVRRAAVLGPAGAGR